jgi:hypothetical protein
MFWDMKSMKVTCLREADYAVASVTGATAHLIAGYLLFRYEVAEHGSASITGRNTERARKDAAGRWLAAHPPEGLSVKPQEPGSQNTCGPHGLDLAVRGNCSAKIELA